ncbi:hypothetical protein RLW55_01345 [Hyphomicrobium sp. B1]|uniref:hypothetical protein n=1 Tax=unclassified Hyphomicrobium TaxID=2619925 RepID=UPI003918A308
MNKPTKRFRSVFDDPTEKDGRPTEVPHLDELMDAVDKEVQRSNIPSLVYPKDEKAKRDAQDAANVTQLPKRARKVNPAPTERFTVELPAYVVKELKQKTITESATVRYLVIKAFKDAGYTVHDIDLFKDGRRGS